MKTIILYATKSKATYECAKILAEKISDCTIVNLKFDKKTTWADFDTIILGSGVRMGKIYKPVRKFIDKNLNTLITKRVAIYLCNADDGLK